MGRGAALTIASDIIQGILLLACAAAFIGITARTPTGTSHTRLFWILMSAGMVLWFAYQCMWSYFEVLERQEVPNPFLGDVVLFLHLVPMIAALAVLPHLRGDERDEQIRMLDFTLLLIWWVFIYIYMVIPWQTVQVDEQTYSANFNFAYLTEKTALLVFLAVLTYTTRGGWQRLYLQLLGAGALYASSSYVANWAIARKTYYSGSVFDIPLTVSIAWIAAVPIFASHYELSDSKPTRPLLGVEITRLSMLALCTLPWAAWHAALDGGLPASVRTFRIIASLIAILVMGIMVFWRQRLLGAELSFFLDQSRRSVDELKALQQQLIQSEKLASLGQLVGGAAHEINNPLTAMLGYSDLLSASSLPALEQQQATRIGEEVRRTKTLVASLLTFARQAPTKLTPIGPNSVLQTAMRLLAPQLESQGIHLRFDLAPSLPNVLADSNQLLHVCLHLAGQIGGYSKSETHSNVLVRTGQAGNSIVIEFLGGKDALAGSSHAMTAVADASTRPPCDRLLTAEGQNKPHTLSLSACCRIVEEHSGKLFESSNSAIQAFRLELPIAAKSAGAQSSRAAAHSGF